VVLVLGNIVFEDKNSLLKGHELEGLKRQLESAHSDLHSKTGAGNDFLGWLDYPSKYDREEFERVKETARKIRKESEIFIVAGIGGSYLGARAIIDALSHSFSDLLPKEKRKSPHILYVGNNLSSNYIMELLEVIRGREVALNVISKSGKTIETSVSFRILREYMEKTYGDRAKDRIYVTTDSEDSAIGELAKKEGYETFTIPRDVGGRYSVLTSVGMLPIAVAGLDVDELMRGAKDGESEYSSLNLDENPCYRYAVERNILNRKGKDVEILTIYDPSLGYFAEWWKQLFGESEGKDGKGILPMSLCFTTDLHSMGQYIQDGKKNLFETVISIGKPKKDFYMFADRENLDGLNYLSGMTVDYINKKAMEGTMKAHVDGGVSNLIINMPELNEYYIGKLIYFFEKACAISGYILGVNPFDQPGVEDYKRNTISLLKEGEKKMNLNII
jgi:glucose-6-phosphate isomerase